MVAKHLIDEGIHIGHIRAVIQGDSSAAQNVLNLSIYAFFTLRVMYQGKDAFIYSISRSGDAGIGYLQEGSFNTFIREILVITWLKLLVVINDNFCERLA